MSDYQPVNIDAEVTPKWLRGEDGKAPKIGAGGNWETYDGERWNDTGTKAQGPKGDVGQTGPAGPAGPIGPKGQVYTPKVDGNGQITWTLNDGTQAPSAANIKGPKGDPGPTGPRGEQGLSKTYPATGQNEDGAMTQKATTDALDAIQVGGRNLLPRSKSRTLNGAIEKPAATANSPIRSGYYWEMKAGSKGEFINFGNSYSTDNVLPLEPNTSYTLSFAAWCKEGTQKLGVDLYPDELPDTKGVDLTAAQKRFTWTFSSGSESMRKCQLRFFGGEALTADVYVTDVKLERGTRATDWTPAPEDIDAKIAALDARLKALEAAKG